MYRFYANNKVFDYTDFGILGLGARNNTLGIPCMHF
jgi:hypothetical protein